MGLEPARRVIILGGGFGGLYAALELDRRIEPDEAIAVTLVDRSAHFTFKPLLYELLSDEVDERDLAPELADVLRGARCVSCLQGEVETVDLAARCVRVRNVRDGDVASLSYDALVIALGAVVHFRGLEGLERYALPAMTLDDFRRIRAKVAAGARTIAICGAGPSGIEIACKLADAGARREITLIEAMGDILPDFPEDMKATARSMIARKSIRLLLETPVLGADERGLRLALEPFALPAEAIIWTAGQRPAPPVEALPVPHDGSGRVLVRSSLEVEGAPGAAPVYALGDAVRSPGQKGGRPPPATAQVAIQQASTVAANILARFRGEPETSFRYVPLGEALTLGRGHDVVRILGLKVAGFPGHVLRRVAYLMRLPGTRHKLRTGARWLADLARAGFELGLSRLRGGSGYDAPRNRESEKDAG